MMMNAGSLHPLVSSSSTGHQGQQHQTFNLPPSTFSPSPSFFAPSSSSPFGKPAPPTAMPVAVDTKPSAMPSMPIHVPRPGPSSGAANSPFGSLPPNSLFAMNNSYMVQSPYASLLPPNATMSMFQSATSGSPATAAQMAQQMAPNSMAGASFGMHSIPQHALQAAFPPALSAQPQLAFQRTNPSYDYLFNNALANQAAMMMPSTPVLSSSMSMMNPFAHLPVQDSKSQMFANAAMFGAATSAMAANQPFSMSQFAGMPTFMASPAPVHSHSSGVSAMTHMTSGGSSSASVASSAAGPAPSSAPSASASTSTPAPCHYKSVIECGVVPDAGKGKQARKTTMYSDFFGEEVKVYTALADPQHRILYKASRLASKLDCAPNMLAMYLARRKKQANSGIFQATSFKYKVEPRSGLKTGGYFVSQEACQEFEKYYVCARTYRGNGANGRADKIDDGKSNASSSPVSSDAKSPLRDLSPAMASAAAAIAHTQLLLSVSHSGSSNSVAGKSVPSSVTSPMSASSVGSGAVSASSVLGVPSSSPAAAAQLLPAISVDVVSSSAARVASPHAEKPSRKRKRNDLASSTATESMSENGCNDSEAGHESDCASDSASSLSRACGDSPRLHHHDLPAVAADSQDSKTAADIHLPILTITTEAATVLPSNTTILTTLAEITSVSKLSDGLVASASPANGIKDLQANQEACRSAKRLKLDSETHVSTA